MKNPGDYASIICSRGKGMHLGFFVADVYITLYSHHRASMVKYLCCIQIGKR